MRPVLALLTGAFLVAAAPADTPADFRLLLPLQLAADAPFQRIDLPATALAASQSASLADVRVFDADGHSLPLARAGAAPRPLVTTETPLTPLPIMGTPGALDVTGVSLKIDAGETRVVRVDGNVRPGTTTVLGVMFDTRGIREPAQALRLDADLPPRQPVSFRVESSPDLRRWQPVGDAVLYANADRPAEKAIPLGGIPLENLYLRLTWATTTPPIAPIVIHGAALRTGRPAAATPGPHIEIAARRDDAHTLSLSLPFAAPVTALTIRPAGDNVLVPVRILGRDNREQPWTLLGTGTAYHLTRAGKPEYGPPIPLANSARLLRIEGDRRTPGFPATPQLRLHFAPASLVVLAQGPPPHRLAVGNAAAQTALLPLASLIPGYRPGAEYALPLASVAAGPAAPLAPAAAESRFGGRQLLLWGVLIAATLVLAGLVLALRRKPG